MSSQLENNSIDPSVVPASIETGESNTNESSVDDTSSPSESRQSLNSQPDKPAGYNPVDPNTASPNEIKDRLDYLYRQVKTSDREKREMGNILRQQSQLLNELSEGQRAVVGHLTQKSFADSKEQLKNAMQEAWKKQDNAGYIEAQNKLMDLQVEERVAAKTQPSQPNPNNQNVPNNAQEIANRAVQAGAIDENEYRQTEVWQNERDERGSLVRPWAYNSDPSHKAALEECRAVFSNPRFENLSHEQKLAEVDRRMGVTKKTISQSVMGGNLTRPSKSTKIDITLKQREIALKTQYAGKGKSEAEHLEAYKKQIEKLQQRRAK